MTFWDFCAPVYDFAQRRNSAFKKSVKAIYKIVPENSTVLDVATALGEISIAIAPKAKNVVGTDLSAKMIKIAKRKASKNNVKNTKFEVADIYKMKYQDNSFDVVIASQVLHLLDNPQKAAAELKQISRGIVITPVCLLKKISFSARVKISIWRLLGFAPTNEFDAKTYKKFLTDIGLPPSEYNIYDGDMPMAVSVWRKK